MTSPYVVSVEIGGSAPAQDAILVEVDPPVGMQRAGRVGETLGKATETLQESLHKVRQAAQTVLDEVADMPHKPQRVSVQFGVKLTAETGVVITKVGGEANFVLTLGWSKAADEPSE
jgi:hypothetical protein